MQQWTTDEMPDCSGRTAVVTGANSGLGYEATRELARAGAHVVMACRSVDRARRAEASISGDIEGASLSVFELDLASLSSIEAFAEALTDDLARLDVLCNNAGVMALPRAETDDGFESQFGINHLGHFALTGRLLGLLEAAPEPRVVTHSSGMHARGSIDFEDPHGETSYDRWDAYAQSKLANVLFAYELDRRHGDRLSSLACHPGWAATNLQRRGPERMGSRLRALGMRAANRLFAQSPKRGALPLLYAATAPDVSGGEYIGPDGFLNMRGYPEPQRSSERSYDEALAERLWSLSESETGVTY
ncbi:oxidoreductase [Natronomonas sp.]|uniref:oxidoreductase n=1 Tax=Natronomonas sp. TaxID=2184060 RepID=UPI0026266F2D|nr:oxidoreductase [Natronomonas sp.]